MPIYSYPQHVESKTSNGTFLAIHAIKPFSYFDMQGEKDGKSQGGAKTASDTWIKYHAASEENPHDNQFGHFIQQQTDATIHMYMPNLLVNTQHEYNDTTISWTQNLTDVVDAATKGYNDAGKGIAGGAEGFEQGFKSAAGTIQKNVLSLFDKAAGGGYTQATGNTVNPKATTMYKGTALRQQTFNFQLKPSNEAEVKSVHEIIKTLRGYSSASISAGGAGFEKIEKKSDFLKIPHFWFLEEIISKSTNPVNPNRDLFKFGPAVLNNVRTNYTPDQYWVMFESGDPVYIDLELQFTELIALTREDIMSERDLNGKSKRGFDL